MVACVVLSKKNHLKMGLIYLLTERKICQDEITAE